MQPAKKYRFYPKLVRDASKGKIFSWKKHLESPHFFEIGMNTYGNSRVEYIDMEEEQMMEALHEFVPLLSRREEEWTNYTELQNKFKARLTPLHLELYLSPGVPCESYLKLTDSPLQTIRDQFHPNDQRI